MYIFDCGFDLLFHIMSISPVHTFNILFYCVEPSLEEISSLRVFEAWGVAMQEGRGTIT
jgi:hypothetical protein